MEYQWYPGHMAKARRQMEQDLKLIDLIIELTDARIPMSGRNPDVDNLGKNKARLVLLNKADLADDEITASWISFFQKQGYQALSLDSRKKNSMKMIQSAINKACAAKIERDRKRGIKNRPVRAMVAGIPNVGKSTFINTFAGKAVAKTGNRPGVTKGKQWIRLNKNTELLDTPGILWPKFEDEQVGIHLALIGSMNDHNLNLDELALILIGFLQKSYPGTLNRVYGITENGTPQEVLFSIAEIRKCLKKGGELDYSRAAFLLLDDFRNGRLGKITLEVPGDYHE